jgi:hypothetical protein
VLLILVARHRLEGIEGRTLTVSLARTIIASALMGAAVVGVHFLLPGIGERLVAVGGLAIGAATYVVAATLLGSEELRQLPRLLLRRGSGADALT